MGCELEDEEATESEDGDNVDEDLLMYTDDEEEDDSSEDEDSDEEIEMDRSIREVRVPQLKWQARSYHTMFNWKKDFEMQRKYTKF